MEVSSHDALAQSPPLRSGPGVATDSATPATWPSAGCPGTGGATKAHVSHESRVAHNMSKRHGFRPVWRGSEGRDGSTPVRLVRRHRTGGENPRLASGITLTSLLQAARRGRRRLTLSRTKSTLCAMPPIDREAARALVRSGVPVGAALRIAARRAAARSRGSAPSVTAGPAPAVATPHACVVSAESDDDAPSSGS